MVDTKNQRNAIVYCVCYVVCRHCRYEDQSTQCTECYVCWDSVDIYRENYWGTFWPIISLIFNWFSIHLKKLRIRAFQLYSQCWHCQYILVHNFLDVQPIFYPFEVLESSQLGLFNCIDSVYMHSIKCIIFCIECHNLYQQCQHTWYLMVWLESPNSQFSKMFLGLKIGYILRKLWAVMCGCVLYWLLWHI